MSRRALAGLLFAALLLCSCASSRKKAEQSAPPFDPSIITVSDDQLTIAAIRYLSASESTDGQLYEGYRLDFEKALAEYLASHDLQDAFALQVERDGITFVFPISFLDPDMLPGYKRPGQSRRPGVPLNPQNPAGPDSPPYDPDAKITFILDEKTTPRQTAGFSALPALVWANSVENLFSMDARGNRIPVLASRAESDSEGRIWEIHLREGIRFADGSELDAAVVSDSWHRNFLEDEQTSSKLSWLWMDIVGATEYVSGRQLSIDGLQVIDELTLRIVMKTPRPEFPEHLMQPCFGISKPSGESNLLIGTGPYQIRNIIKPSTDLTFVCSVNQFYHGDLPRLSELKFVIQNDRVIDVMMYQENAGTVVKLKKDIEYFRKLNGVRALPFPVQPVYFLALNPLSGPLTDISLRQYIVSTVLRRWEIENIMTEAEAVAAPGFSLEEELQIVSPPRDSVPDPARPLIISYSASDGVARQIAERLHARFDQTGIPSQSPRALPEMNLERLRQSGIYDILVDSFVPAFTSQSYNLFQLLKSGYEVDPTSIRRAEGALAARSSNESYALEKRLIESAVFHPLIRVKYYLVLPAELRGATLYCSQFVDLSGAWIPRN